MGLRIVFCIRKPLGKVWIGSFMPQMQTLPQYVNLDSGGSSPSHLCSLLGGGRLLFLLLFPALCGFILDRSLLVLALNGSWPAVRYAAKQSSSYVFTMFFREG